LIKLLFGEAKQFYVQNCNILAQDYNIDILMQFILNNLISEFHRITLWPMDDASMKKYKNDLFKILLYGGDNFGKVYVTLYSTPEFNKNVYNHIVEVSYLTGVNPPTPLRLLILKGNIVGFRGDKGTCAVSLPQSQ